jgi:hypothetical protein
MVLYTLIVVVVAVCFHSLGHDEGFEQGCAIKDREIDRLWAEVKFLRNALDHERRTGDAS